MKLLFDIFGLTRNQKWFCCENNKHRSQKDAEKCKEFLFDSRKQQIVLWCCHVLCIWCIACSAIDGWWEVKVLRKFRDGRSYRYIAYVVNKRDEWGDGFREVFYDIQDWFVWTCLLINFSTL